MHNNSILYIITNNSTVHIRDVNPRVSTVSYIKYHPIFYYTAFAHYSDGILHNISVPIERSAVIGPQPKMVCQ